MTMTQQIDPIMLRKFSFKRSMLDHIDVLTGLDRGCSLTKIIYVDKSDAEKVDKASNDLYIPLTVALFSNAQFEDALLWLKDHALFPESKEPKFHVTGAGGVKFSEKIKEILEREVVFVDEFMSQSRGAYYLLKNVPLEEMTFPPLQDESGEIISTLTFNNIKKQFKEVVGEKNIIKSNDDFFPCIFGFLGSGGAFTFLDNDGKFRMTSGVTAAGKTFVGLARCMLGTNNYKEITDMAAKGDRRNIDAQIKDVIKSDIPVNGFSSNLSIFNFGKLAQGTQNINDVKKEDIAHSLVSMFALNTLTTLIHLCMAEKVTNVFVGGNLYQAEIFRKEFQELQRTFQIDFINIYFINNGHTAALGAMISLDGDMEKYFHV